MGVDDRERRVDRDAPVGAGLVVDRVGNGMGVAGRAERTLELLLGGERNVRRHGDDVGQREALGRFMRRHDGVVDAQRRERHQHGQEGPAGERGREE